MDVSKGVDPACRFLTVEDKLNLARYRALDEIEREIVNLLVAAFQECHQRKQGIDVQSLLGGFQERQLIAA